MTNEEFLAKIKAEIERISSRAMNEDGQDLCGYLLSFLDTLEEKSEKPMNLDFEQELYKRFGMVKDFTLGMRIAQAFYDLGCRRTAEKFDEIEYNRQRAEESVPNDLEEAALSRMRDPDMYLSEAVIDEIGDELLKMAQFGAKWQKEQMMKEAVEDWAKDGMEIHSTIVEKKGGIDIVECPVNAFYEGQKVRIIIVKE